MLVPDEVRKSVVFVCFRGHTGIQLAGTAFFVAVKRDEIDSWFVYVVTAKHVLDGIKKESVDGKIYLRVNFAGKPADLVLTDVNAWRFHPSASNVDVAVMPWAPDPSLVDYAFIPVEMAATDDVIKHHSIGPGDEVFLTGLFANHYGRQRNLPIIRLGNIAAMPEEPLNTKDLGVIDAFLIEVRSIGGLSGSPVFVHLGGARTVPGKGTSLGGSSFYWLGLMHGHFDLSTLEHDQLETDALTQLRINMGIAIVVPVSKILEVIDQEYFMESRRKADEEEKQRRAPTPDSVD